VAAPLAFRARCLVVNFLPAGRAGLVSHGIAKARCYAFTAAWCGWFTERV
jgi:hypothetical protein